MVRLVIALKAILSPPQGAGLKLYVNFFVNISRI